MDQKSRKQTIVIVGILVLFGIPLLPLGASFLGLLPWSPVNCWHHEVDIRSGRVRFTRCVLGLQIRQTVDNSSLTAALHPEDFRDKAAEWHRVTTFSPGLHNSPHYVFHSAIHQMRRLEVIWKSTDFTPEARRATAKRVLQLWQEEGDDSKASEYLHGLETWTLSRDAHAQPITEAELPQR